MLKRLSLHKILLFALSLILVACSQSSSTIEPPVPEPIQPPGSSDQNFEPINQVFFGFVFESENEGNDNPLLNVEAFNQRAGQLSILSFDPDSDVDTDPNDGNGQLNPTLIRTDESGLVVSLDTEFGANLQPEFTLYIEQDSLFSINHLTNEIRFLSQFSNTVCEILPYKTVSVSGDAGQDQTLTLVDASTVYIRTSEASCFGNNSGLSEQDVRYFRVALNFKSDATDGELCVENGGSNQDVENCFSNDFTPVLESEARAQLVFTWTDDTETSDPNDHMPTWGYLGYGNAEQSLKLFDSERTEIWSQDRRLLTLEPFALGQNEFSPSSIAQLSALDNDSGDLLNPVGFNYLLQLGRDLFVFDANIDLFDVPASQLDRVFSDRTYRLDQVFGDDSTQFPILEDAEFFFDDNEVVIVDAFRVHRYDYSASRFVPNVSREFSIRNFDNVYNPLNPRDNVPFTQFDIISCEEASREEIPNPDDDGPIFNINQTTLNECLNAHDVDDSQLPAPGPAWAFITDCDIGLGCVLPENLDNVCITDDELAADPSLADANNPCSVLNFEDLDELDDESNNAEFRGFMQYADNNIRSLDFELNDDALFITARMLERDILLKYNYNESLVAARSLREQVLLGTRFSHHGIKTRLLNGDLYVELLRESATRSNECTKNYQNVPCELGNVASEGAATVCTGFDLVRGDCTSEVREYQSYTLFCSAADIAAGNCVDEGVCPVTGPCDLVSAPIGDLLVSGVGTLPAKWLTLRQQTDSGVEESMKIALSQFQFDEGVLQAPVSLFEFDTSVASRGVNAIASVSTDIESFSDFVGSANGNHLSTIPLEIVEIGGGAIETTVSDLSQHVILDLSETQQVVPEAGNLQFLRPITELSQ